MMTCVLTLLAKTSMKKAYRSPEMKEVSLRRSADLLGCSSSDGDMTPCIDGPIGMDYKGDSHNG